jgi:cytochrome c5
MEQLVKIFALAGCLLIALAGLAVSGIAQERTSCSTRLTTPSIASDADKALTNPMSPPNKEAAAALESGMRIEGEKRFRANCGRCHMAPHKFPPRVIATAIRHMRVRATLTDEDMRFILHYMTQ